MVDILERGMLEEKRGEERALYWLGSAPIQQASAACRTGQKLKGRATLATGDRLRLQSGHVGLDSHLLSALHVTVSLSQVNEQRDYVLWID